MLQRIPMLPVGFCLALIVSPTALGLDVRISLSRAKGRYVVDEPVTAWMTIENVSDQTVWLAAKYPRNMGLGFVCDDADDHGPMLRGGSGGTPSLSIEAGVKRAFLIVLNRHYLTFSKPKRYLVHYQVGLHEQPPRAKRSGVLHKAAGSFTIDIVPGRLEHDEIVRACDLTGKEGQEFGNAVEYLLWMDSPLSIEPLEHAAAQLPDSASEIVQRLSEFAHMEKAKKALYTIAKDGDQWTLDAVLKVCVKHDFELPYEFYRGIALSDHPGKQYALISYIEARGDPRYRELARLLTHSVNEIVTQKAIQFLERFNDSSAVDVRSDGDYELCELWGHNTLLAASIARTTSGESTGLRPQITL